MEERIIELLQELFQEHLDMYGDSVLLDAYINDSDELDMVKLPEEIADLLHEIKELVDEVRLDDELKD